ncbi:protein-tyrosine phosphatase [Enterococcus sp. DIV0212c]|uniref:tyrosine-protein phosphatase n=1 Tax=Enterococcus sp. DIV0212c TaxID=2230867 RepID=UPI001A9AC599|nr:tyrosine-protein phosphatase [Enterococcus sp. DIV0212c]MBO1354387.1 tyrosine-protein phosphatase [Enterococcus sp. DIV0212c]
MMQALQVKRDGNKLVIYITDTVELPVKVYYGTNSSTLNDTTYFEFYETGWQKLTDPDPKERLYFYLKSNVTTFIGAERRVPLTNLYNCRDMGGYLTTDNRLTSWGKIFRSDALHQIDEQGQEYIERMGVKRIIDFRSPEEIAKDPNKLISTSETFNFNPHANVAQQASTQSVSKKDEDKIAQLEVMVQTDEGRQQLIKNRNVMIKQMEQLVVGANAIEAYKQFFKTLLQDDVTPLIFHCQGGKDRTGWAAALYLGALGVDKEQIYQDYLLTDQMNAPRNAKRMAIYKKYTDNEDVLAFLASLQQTREDYLDGAYNTVEKRYGTITNYLKEVLVVDKDQLEILRNKYLY